MSSDSEEVRVKPEPVANGRKVKAGVRHPDEENLGSAKGKKRARRENSEPPADDEPPPANQQQPEVDNDDQEQQDSDDDEEERPALVRDAAGYVPGSIVRVAVENFVTYDKVEFTPGPALNMVLGPNGTGKSTIACAIALGLGYSPKVLGRSSKVSEFVKTGAQEGWVEIELKGLPGKRNAIIRRYLNKDNEQTRFQFNGQLSSAKDVAAKMEELHVQVGNLCTFLPQDRVSSFAQLSAPDLLKETQKAAGDSRLSGWHETLIVERRNQADLQKSLAENEDELKRREDKQAENERDVRLYEARQKLEFELAVVSLLIPIAEYNDAREKHTEAKALRTQLKEELKELEEANRPFKDSHETLKRMVGEFDHGKKVLQGKASKASKDMNAKLKAIEGCEKDVEKTRDELEGLKQTEKERKRFVDNLEKEIEKLEAATANPPAPPDYGPVNAEIAAKGSERQVLVAQLTEVTTKGEDATAQLQALKRDEQRINKEGSALQNVQRQKENQCERWDPDTMAAVRWMREQKKQGNFKGNVYEPARLSVSPKDPRYTDMAEGPISQAIFRTFVFETREDYDFMMKTLNDNKLDGKQLRINGAELKAGKHSRSAYPNRYNADQMARWGFDCFAIDLIDGPDAVLAYLCENANLNSVPISLGKNQLNHREIEAANVSRYFTPDGSHSIKRSRYGAQGNLVEMRPLTKAKIMGQGVDQGKLDDLRRQKNEIQPKMEEVGAIFSQASKDEDELRQQIASLEMDRRQLAKKREAMKDPIAKHERALVGLNSKRAQLDKEKRKPSTDATRDQLKKQMANITIKRVQYTLESQDLLFKVDKLTIDATAIQLRQIQADGDLRAMSTSVDEKDREIQDKQRDYDEANVTVNALRATAQEAQQRSLDALEAGDDETKAEVARRRSEQDPVLEELLKTQLTTQASLDVMQDVSPSVLAKYERRKIEIAAYREKVDDEKATLEKATSSLKKIEGKWLPKLEDLVNKVSTKFSSAFQTLGLVGEIRLAKEVDYDKWGIEILVSFRDKEALQVLTSHRQSGGERALTTVMYLMSLASLAKAPFALVDEINQGMDQRVERNVHNALVATTCRDDVGQYFLITPKLLPNLNYHAKMKVLVIQNGEDIPEKLSLKEVVARKLRRRGLTPTTSVSL